jgi:tripartite-type tricarboxylate transporter receptor subunit TctC
MLAMITRRASWLVTAVVAGCLPWTASAQTYPARTVRLIVPFTPGGVTDNIARILAQKLSDRLGQPFVVESRPGAGGNIGTAATARAPADGYTLLVIGSSFMINPSLYAQVLYDPVKDFLPVAAVATTPVVLVVNPSLRVNNVSELIALLKSHPGKYSYASPGVGNPHHLAGERFKLAFGLDLVHVPFAGGPPSIASTIAGHTPIAFGTVTTTAGYIADGSLRALAVLSRRRISALPDVPTMAESGVPGQEAENMTGIVAPAHTNEAIVDLLQREIAAIIRSPDVKTRLAALGVESAGSTPQEFGAQIRTEIARWRDVIRQAGISIK